MREMRRCGAPRRARRWRQAGANEDGFALILTLLTLSISSLLFMSVIQMTSSSGRDSTHFRATGSADALAEAGISYSMSVLSNPSNNALNPNLLPARTVQLEGGTVTWAGTFDAITATWTLTSTGSVVNPTGPSARPITRTLRARSVVIPTFSQPLNSPAWNYIYSRDTGNTCDMTLGQTVSIGSPLFVNGNLCLNNQSKITKGPLVVGGRLALAGNNNTVGTSAAPISSANIGNGCSKGAVFQSTCTGGAAVNVFANVVSPTIPSIPPPAVDWDGWYLAANPGPYFPCTSSSGIPPVFDNDQGTLLNASVSHRNNSLPTVVDLTPPYSYSCTTVAGELSWNSLTRVLTANGTIFIDGSAKILNGQVNSYEGFATIYVSGTLLVKNSTMCAVLNASRTSCTSSGWLSNSQMLVFVVNGDGATGGAAGQVGVGNGAEVVSGYFQGALYATRAIDIATTSQADGPLDGGTVKLGQSVAASWPAFTIVPAGMPGNPVAYAEPQAPTYG